MRPSDTIGRRARDEFVILLPDLHAPEDAQFVARKILTAMASPFDIGARGLKVSTSIGVAVRRPDEKDTSSILRRADEALHQAKAGGSQHVQGQRLALACAPGRATRQIKGGSAIQRLPDQRSRDEGAAQRSRHIELAR